ncbi:MAG TPA: hypothetical protein VEW42_02600 [Candidatus Eisenbacteria bacterium]|nr:hypothetical protein [Candidatus Eisenbacteria bacterium]
MISEVDISAIEKKVVTKRSRDVVEHPPGSGNYIIPAGAQISVTARILDEHGIYSSRIQIRGERKKNETSVSITGRRGKKFFSVRNTASQLFPLSFTDRFTVSRRQE